uniref:Transmembrane protein 120A n=1 Tax=Sus scrofa TaxID=9823 RepID=A0A8D1P4H5_PIG
MVHHLYRFSFLALHSFLPGCLHQEEMPTLPAPTPRPPGRLSAGLGGAAAGLPRHPGDPPTVPPEAGRADQAAEQLYQLHHPAEEAAPGAGPCPEEVRTCPPYCPCPLPDTPDLGLGAAVRPCGMEMALTSRCKHSLPSEAEEAAQELESQIKERQGLFFDMEAYLPKKNGLYLSLVLGNVNVTLLSKQAKFAYKAEYEKFKLYLTIILILVSFTCRFLLNSRVTDAAFNFLLVWYYCTLTIRESILINNGSRIKGWWVFHHYVSTFLSGVMLTWPDGLMYQKFRNQFLSFSMYQSFVQFLQYYYQSGCLYRLRALGERHTMDLTVEGFQSWMWRGLTFLLPFLFFGQFWQLFNALTLFSLARDPECKEWQVLMCGLPFLLLFLGNFFTTLRVVHQKFHNQQHGGKKD